MSGGGIGTLVTLFTIALVIGLGSFVVFMVYRNTLREAKNYERGLKMVPIFIYRQLAMILLATGVINGI